MARSVMTPDFSTAWHVSQMPPLARLFLALAYKMARWDSVRRSRRALSTLDKRLLADIGLDQYRAEEEALKPFWRS